MPCWQERGWTSPAARIGARQSCLEGEEITVSTPRLGIQLIIFRDRPQKDLAGVLRDVARAGYDGVEAGNLFRGADPAHAKRSKQGKGCRERSAKA